jgi:hypothetical protein
VIEFSHGNRPVKVDIGDAFSGVFEEYVDHCVMRKHSSIRVPLKGQRADVEATDALRDTLVPAEVDHK